MHVCFLFVAEPIFEDNGVSEMSGNNKNGTTTISLPPKKKDEDTDLKHLSGDTKCTTKFWRCIGHVVQGGAHYLQEPGGISK